MKLPLTSAVASGVVFLDSVESTNSYSAVASDKFADYGVVVSVNQTAGRGRRGRQWVSVPGQTLAASIVVPFETSSVASTWLPILAGVAVVQSLEKISDQEVDLKWPNDLLVQSKKVGGILCEMISSKRSIVGVGTNLSVPEKDLPENGGSIWHPDYGFERAVDIYLSSLVGNLRAILKLASKLSTGELIARELAPLIATVGKTVRVHENHSLSWSGQAIGLSRQGHLVVRLDGGEDREVVAADIQHLRE